MSQSEVAVLMCVKNTARYVAEAVDSVLKQSFSDFLFVIVDDGSTDGTAEILQKFSEQDSRIKLIQLPKSIGIPAALNRGLENLQCEYLFRMDGDDIASADRLAKQLSAMKKSPDLVALGSSVEYIDQDGKQICFIDYSAPKKSLFERNIFVQPTMVIRTSKVPRAEFRYNEYFALASDYELWLRLQKYGKMQSLPDILLKWRKLNSSARFENPRRMIWFTVMVKLAAMRREGHLPTLREILRLAEELALLLLPNFFIYSLYKKFFLEKLGVQKKNNSLNN